ncbi:MAG: DUF6116 family protein [Acidobacteriota bacterium]
MAGLASLFQTHLRRLKYPWLLALVAGLFVVDVLIPDPIPLLDELMIGTLTVLLAMWRERPKEGEGETVVRGDKPPPRNVTPDDA